MRRYQGGRIRPGARSEQRHHRRHRGKDRDDADCRASRTPQSRGDPAGGAERGHEVPEHREPSDGHARKVTTGRDDRVDDRVPAQATAVSAADPVHEGRQHERRAAADHERVRRCAGAFGSRRCCCDRVGRRDAARRRNRDRRRLDARAADLLVLRRALVMADTRHRHGRRRRRRTGGGTHRHTAARRAGLALVEPLVSRDQSFRRVLCVPQRQLGVLGHAARHHEPVTPRLRERHRIGVAVVRGTRS